GAVLVDPEIGKAGDIDTAIVNMKLSSGAIAVINNCRRASYGYDQRLEAFGSLGQVEVQNDTDSTAVISNADGVTKEKPKYFFLQRYMAAYTAEIESFVRAVENDTDVEVGVIDGLEPVLIGLAATRSVKEGRPVKISELRAEYGL
ncbi:MAG TPA: inositol 2-dehydrogenase, partial [Candidatus Stercoripulliclostridium merdigallinarum]|nr:inositol 2-dehydrogenase [Candidatus Stercoripulliclostridium merdigallinarum]